MSDIIEEGPCVYVVGRLGSPWGLVAEGSDWAVWMVDVTHRLI